MRNKVRFTLLPLYFIYRGCFRPKEIQFTSRMFRGFVAHALELDVSSYGGSEDKALRNLKEAVRLFLKEAETMGTLEQILREAKFTKTTQKVANPKFFRLQRVTVPLPSAHAKV